MKVNLKKGIKWIPVLIAAFVAGVQTVGEIKGEDRIDQMEKRIENLENKRES